MGRAAEPGPVCLVMSVSYRGSRHPMDPHSIHSSLQECLAASADHPHYLAYSKVHLENNSNSSITIYCFDGCCCFTAGGVEVVAVVVEATLGLT